jgi:hypothetical protein
MNTICIAAGNINAFGNSPDVGVSSAAGYLKDKDSEFQKNISGEANWYMPIWDDILEAIHEYSTNDWDGYGARAITSDSVNDALRFAKALPIAIPAPEISVDANGELIFEWYKEPKKVFSIIIEGKNRLIYAGLFGINKTNGTEYFSEELPETILYNIQRLLS